MSKMEKGDPVAVEAKGGLFDGVIGTIKQGPIGNTGNVLVKTADGREIVIPRRYLRRRALLAQSPGGDYD